MTLRRQNAETDEFVFDVGSVLVVGDVSVRYACALTACMYAYLVYVCVYIHVWSELVVRDFSIRYACALTACLYA